MERMLDKRKARDKETDEESDASPTKNPTKRPRVEYSSSASPKEKSPSPASAQKSPLKSASVADSLTAATPASNDAEKSESNGDVVASSPKSGSAKNGSSEDTTVPDVISNFDLETQVTKEEVDEKIGKIEPKDDSDSDNDSTKFLSGIIQSEENKKKQKEKGNGASSASGDSGSTNGTSKRGGSGTTTKTHSKLTQPTLTSSPLASDGSATINGNASVEVSLKVINPDTKTVLLENLTFTSDVQSVDQFLRQNGLTMSVYSSQNLSNSSGYLGDISSMDTIASLGSSKSAGSGSGGNNRWTISSLGSTIPRTSMAVSIATDTSDSPDEVMKRPSRPVSKARKRSDGPILTSTKIDESTEMNSASYLDKMNVSSNSLSNGDELIPSQSSSKSGRGSVKSQSPKVTGSPIRKNKGTPASKLADEGLGTPSQASSSATPGSSRKSGMKSTPGNNISLTSDSGVGKSSGKKPAVRRRVGSASNFPITTTPVPVLNTPPPARSVAKIEGTSAKPLMQYEIDMNKEPVLESELEKAQTLWSTILPEELVFARWRDKNYYSGMVKSKGLNDTWIIDFDDGMEDVASESHIVPIRILGVGLKGVYSPDEKYEAKNAEVIGQKFLTDDNGTQVVKYAIKIAGESKPIWCSRRQLSIKEADAKKLRSEFQPVVLGGKAGDVSLDNIVSGPRRRTRGGGMESETSSLSDSKNTTGFDPSSADDKLDVTAPASTTSTATPKAKSATKLKKTPASESRKKRTAATGAGSSSGGGSSTPAPATKDASTSSPEKDIVEKKEKESPAGSKKEKEVAVPKNSVIEFGKKKPKKTLFQGIQFFLTACGGGDPGTSGRPMTPPEPYDKDEIREWIEGCGGEIIDVVGTETCHDILLISDSYARTVKYIYSLAGSIPCLSHSWIKRCMELSEIVEWNVFRLPAGWSLEHQDLITHHTKKPLKGFKVFVTSESDQLYNYWKPVLTAAEAILLKAPRKKGRFIPSDAEIVVTDTTSENSHLVIREAKASNIPAVRPEWLVQTIIMGEKAHMYGHDKYKLLLTEEDTEESNAMDESKENINNEEALSLANQETPD